MDVRRALIIAGFVALILTAVAGGLGGFGILVAIICWVAAWRLGKGSEPSS